MNKVDFPVLAAQIKGGLTFPGGGNSSALSGLDFQETLSQFLAGSSSEATGIRTDLSGIVPQTTKVTRPTSSSSSSFSIIRPAELQMTRSARALEKISTSRSTAGSSSQEDVAETDDESLVNEAGAELDDGEKAAIKAWKDRVEEIIRESGLENPVFLLDQLRADPETAEVFLGLDDETAMEIITGIQNAIRQESGVASLQVSSSLTDELLSEKLAQLRKDPTDGEFWRSLDDTTALNLLATVLAGKLPTALDSSLTETDFLEGMNAEGEKVQGRIFRDEQGSNRKDDASGKSSQTDSEEAASGNPSLSGSEEKAGLSVETRLEHMERMSQKFADRFAAAEQAQENAVSGSAGNEQGVVENTLTFAADPIHQSQRSSEAVDGMIARIVRQEPTPGNPDGKTLVLEPLTVQKAGRMADMGGFGQGTGSNLSGDSSGGMAKTQNSVFARFQEPVRATLFSEIVAKAHLLKGPETQKTLTIQLKPEFLGKVHLELTSKDGGLTGRIVAENPQVREKMEELVPQIKNHLAEQGINLTQLTVDVFTRNPDEGKRDGFAQAEQHRLNVAAAFNRRGRSQEVVEGTGPVVYHDPLVQGIDIRI
jgi:flagellar hook-length control protein FliK